MLQRICLSVAGVLLGLCSVARAEQFVLVDLDYTHSADTTKDSHYYVKLPADTPKDWTKPADYSTGSVHLIVDVKTKPAGDAKTQFQVCFEGTPSYGCTLQSPTYTKVGRVEWDSPFKDFWYESTVDWSKGIKAMPLILKDDANNKPAGDPKYMPTDLHVQVTLVSAGSKFVAPPAAGSGGAGGAVAGAGVGGAAAGAGGRGGAGAGASGSAGSQPGAAGAAVAGSSAMAAAASGTGGTSASVAGRASVAGASASTAGKSSQSVAGAASPGSTGTAGATGTSTNNQTAAGDTASASDSGGCRAAGSGASGAWPLAAAFAYFANARRRKRRESRG
jgi:hypothetical protein